MSKDNGIVVNEEPTTNGEPTKADEDKTITEKFEELPPEKQEEVAQVDAIMDGENLAEIQTIIAQEEKDVYYDKTKMELSYLPITEDNTDANKVRLGTIGAVDYSKLPDVKIHLNAANDPVYEIDDGQDNFDRATRDNLTASGYKIKRSFIDSSIVNLAGLVAYLEQKAIDEKWFSAMTDNLITELHNDIVKEK